MEIKEASDCISVYGPLSMIAGVNLFKLAGLMRYTICDATMGCAWAGAMRGPAPRGAFDDAAPTLQDN